MRIAIPVNEESIDAPVCVSFGRAPYFLLYNSITKETDYLDNNAVAASGGAGAAGEHVAVIANTLRRLDEMLQGLLKFSRPEELKLWSAIRVEQTNCSSSIGSGRWMIFWFTSDRIR